MSALFRATFTALLFVASLAHAVTFTVNSTLDQPDDLTMPGTCHTSTGTCTLRAAVMQANRASGIGATIVVPPGVYTLTIAATATDGEADGDLNLTNPAIGQPTIVITGAGIGVTTIDGNQIDRVFHVHDKRTAQLNDLTVRNAFWKSDPGAAILGGGAILNEGTLKLDRVELTGNASDVGGGITNAGYLIVSRSTIHDNHAETGYGGGLYNKSNASLADTVIARNVAGVGGGVLNSGTGRLRITRSTVNDNTSRLDGGGIHNFNEMTIVETTISQNSADNNGGGIANFGNAYVYNATIAFNLASANPKSIGSGGGIANVIGTSNLSNSLIVGNTVRNATTYDDCSGSLTLIGGVNVFYNAPACVFFGSGGNRATLASLATIGPLADNGGPTPTHALLAGSTAIDLSPLSQCVDDAGAALATDQRGYTRVAGPYCDIGAFEYNALPPTADAIEYRHAAFDHYFVTDIADEIGKLDAGTIAGWTRTGLSFKVYTDTTPSLAGVCRFFSAAFVPKSSHFYTPSAPECETVKKNPDWAFEAVVFYMAPADANGGCAAGTQPVYRMYNNGQGAAPNHRYTTSLAIRSQMLAQGWIPEGYGPVGVIMCAPL